MILSFSGSDIRNSTEEELRESMRKQIQEQTTYYVVNYDGYIWDEEHPPTLQEIKDLGGVRFTGTEEQCLNYKKAQVDGASLDITQGD